MALLRQERTQTLDAMVARLGARAHDLGNGLSPQARHRLDQQILEAKVATAALFLNLETRARDTGLHRYQQFLDELFGNRIGWSQAARECDRNVLTFNYDRLFEMAFIDHFKPDLAGKPLYGKQLLNSGMDYATGSGIDVEHRRFCFLKLHGSVGIRARQEEGHDAPTHYTQYDGLPGKLEAPINDNRFFADEREPNPYHRDPEPLIVFPHEKPFAAEGMATLVSYRGYVSPIWKEARRLIGDATTVRVIGYRFAPVDQDDVLRLLRAGCAGSCKKIIIQNRPDSVQEICHIVKSRWLEPAGLHMVVEADPFPF